MTDPATTPTTAAEDPRDRRRRTAAVVCAALAGLGTGIVIGAANQENLGDNAVLIAINGASILALWALITLSTSAAVRQLVETTLTKFRAIVEESQAWCLRVLREAVREEVREQIAEPTQEVAGRLGRVQDRLGIRPDDDPAGPTVPLIYRSAPVQHVIGVAPVGGVYNGRMEAAVNQAMERLTTHVDGRIDDALEDVRALIQNEPKLRGGKVVGLPLNQRP